MTVVNTDRIEKKILLRAPRARVWRAITDAREFGSWFGMRLDGPFKAGEVVHGEIVPTTVDPEAAKAQEPYTGLAVDILVERIDPEQSFAFRWHPGAVDPGIDYTKEPMTLVEFTLDEVAEGIMLTVIETGFDKLPAARRARAFADNESGWELSVGLVEKYLARHP
jgi:uncharacterized protein YndB with AHSA1/START domain